MNLFLDDYFEHYYYTVLEAFNDNPHGTCNLCLVVTAIFCFVLGVLYSKLSARFSPPLFSIFLNLVTKKGRISSIRIHKHKLNKCLNSQTSTLQKQLFLTGFNHLIAENYANASFSKQLAASSLNMDPRTLSRKLSKYTDLTFQQHLKKYRLHCAKQNIIRGEQITKVCFDVGFNNTSHFSTSFKEEFGVPPSKYIDIQR